MVDEEILRKAIQYQSFSPRSGKRNEYNGLDNLSIGYIQDKHLYALVHDGNLNDLKEGKPSRIEYFFDQATYDKYVDSRTGKFDAKVLSEALQVKPYQSSEMASTDGHAEYRYSIVCFDRKGDVKAAVGICEANTQFGGGGAHQAFIPAEVSEALQANGVLKYNSGASNIRTGQNYIIGADDYGKIQAASDERCENCEEKGLEHPEPEACKNGFPFNPAINGTPFNALIIDNDTDYAIVLGVDEKIEEEAPPLLYDLNALQVEANRLYGLTAEETLDIAQELYESGNLTYPRTSSHNITPDMKQTVALLLSDDEANS